MGVSKMTEKELKKEAEEYAEGMTKYYASTHEDCIPSQFEKYLRNAYISSAEPREKRIEELEQKISVLLSCKKCPENKGGFICQKEYEDKCLSQKIQYIKELQEENAELKADNDARKFAMAMSEKVEKQLRKENAELKGIKDVATLIRANNDTVTTLMQLNNMLVSKSQQLTKVKELLRKLVLEVKGYEEINGFDACEPVQEAEQFLNSEVEK